MMVKLLPEMFERGKLITFICISCGHKDRSFGETENKFKKFVNLCVNKGSCRKCESKDVMFRTPNGNQLWIKELD